MEPERNRDVVTMNSDPDTYVTPATYVTPGATTPLAPPPRAVVVEHAPTHEVDVVSVRSVSPYAVAAGLMAIAMIVWGGVVMARAGFDGGLREPQASMLDLTGNALSGVIVAGLGLVLLLSALATDRAAIMFTSIIIGIAALIVAIEPGVADGALGVERSVPVLLAIGSAVVLMLAAIVPTMTNRTRTIERV
jgi:hypothetical protein